MELSKMPGSLPLLPLRDVVVFPHMIAPLLVGRPASIQALHHAMTEDKLLFVTAQRNPDVADPKRDDLHRIGVVARVLQLLPLPDGSLKILIEGLVRARMSRLYKKNKTHYCKLQVLQDVEEPRAEIEALQRSVAEQFSEYVQMNRRIPDEVLMSVVSLEDPSTLADTIAAHLISKLPVKQKVLASMDLKARFHSLAQILNEELEILRIEARIEGEIRNQVEKGQKEIYLNERLKAIRKELGHEDELGGSEVEELAALIEKAKMPKHAIDMAYKELERLARMPPMSPEAGVVRTWLETLSGLPWKKETRDQLNLIKVKAQLDADHFGLERVKDRILEYLAVMKLTKSLRGPILCLVGPPGVGKTSLGRSIAASLGRRFVRVSLGGIHDEAEIRGHRRTYIGAMPGRILQGLRRAKSRNPVFLLDEIDKLGNDYRGDPSSALLEALDPEQNNAFSDHYCEVSFDLSKVFFLTTANTVDSIPPALRDRLEIIHLSAYLDHEKRSIAQDFLLPKQLKEHGIDQSVLKVDKSAIDCIIHRYTREAGVRQMERQLGALCRKVARRVVEAGVATKKKSHGTAARGLRRVPSKSKGWKVSSKGIAEYLGVPPYTRQEIELETEVGVATGLAWTAAGGEILPIECTRMDGRGELILTGQLGDVMKESARAALSFVRSIAPSLGIRKTIFAKTDIHIHVPEGAIPKDGPSAGLAMAIAMISQLTQRPVLRRVAMTGEITLRGRVLPIGGLHEKTIAALRAGVEKVIVPAGNAKDLEDLPKHVIRGLEIVTISDSSEVFDHVLVKKVRRPRRTTSSTTGRASRYTH